MRPSVSRREESDDSESGRSRSPSPSSSSVPENPVNAKWFNLLKAYHQSLLSAPPESSQRSESPDEYEDDSDSPIDDLDCPKLTCPWTVLRSDFQTDDNSEYFNPACQCGGGTYLGNVRQISMYENHRSIDCIIQPTKSPMPYLSSYYFNALKSFESSSSGDSTYETKVSNLLLLWKESLNLFTDNPCSGTHVFLHYAASESAYLILQPEWEDIETNVKTNLSLIMKQILYILKILKCHLDAIKSCQFLLSIIDNPWGHHYLPKLLHGNPSKKEVANFIQFEKSNIYTMRLKLLCDQHCEIQALKLSSLAMNLDNFELKSRHHFEEQDFEFIRDMFYACLEKLEKRKELVNHLIKFTPDIDGENLLNRYCNNIQPLLNVSKQSQSSIYKHMIFVYELAATILIATSLKNSINIDGFTKLLNKWCTIILTVMESNLNPTLCERTQKAIHLFILKAPSASHVYMLCDVIRERFGFKLPRKMYLQIHIGALAANINEKERFKKTNNKDATFNSLKMLVQGYLKMANQFEDILSVCRECVLTAYSLMPSSDLMIRVKNLAIKSGKISSEPEPTNVPINSCENSNKDITVNPKGRNSKQSCKNNRKSKVLKSAPALKVDYLKNESYHMIESELKDYLGSISETELTDVVAVLKYPRLAKFNWDSDWSKINNLCQKYLENLESVIERSTLIRSEFKYVDIDVEEFNKYTEMIVRLITNDKGYFTSDENDSDDESIVSAASSGDMVCFSTKNRRSRSNRKKSRSRKRKAAPRKKPSKVRPPKKPKVDPPKVTPISGVQTRRSARVQKSYEEADEISNSSFQNKTQSTSLNCYKIEDNSVDSVSEENVEVQNSKLNEKNKPLPRVMREKRIINKNQHKDFDYSWSLRRKGKSSKNKEELEHGNMKTTKNDKDNEKSKSQPNNIHLMENTNFDLPHSNSKHLNMLSERIPQLSSLDFIVPANTNHIVNVVQIQTTSNTLTNVSQTQTEHVSNLHSNNDIEKKNNENQTNAGALDDFVSVYQSNSLNNSINSTQSTGIHQAECSFTGSVSVSNQRITTDPTTNVHSTGQQDTSKPVGTHDMINQNQMNVEHRNWNDIQLQNSEERQTTSEDAVHLSSNVIVRTSDVINPSHVTITTGQITNTTKKSSGYCVKTRERFDLSLPASISSVSTNNSRSTNIPATMNSKRSTYDSKVQQNSPIQTSVGLQVNFNNQQSENIQSIMSPNNQHSQICTSISDNSTSTNISILNDNTLNLISSTSSMVNSPFMKENNSFDTIKSNISIANPVSSTQTQTCIGLRPSNEISTPSSSVISLMIASTQSQVIKTNVHNALYTSSQNQRIQLPDLNHTSQINRSDEQKKIDNLKLKSQTFTATSEAIKFVTSSTESQRLIHTSDKNSASNLSIFQNTTESVSNISQENDSSSKSSTKVRGNMRTYESKTRALNQANMSDMFVFEKGTLYAVQDDAINQVESSKSVSSSRNNTISNVKMQNRQAKETLEKPKPSPNASPNITITGSMLPRFQQVFGKTKFQSSTVINDTSSLCSTNVVNIPSSNPGPIVNRTNLLTSRVYSSSKGVQTNHDVDPIICNTLNSISPKLVENKLQHNIGIPKPNNVMALGNNKNNVIMTCKTVSSVKNIPQISVSSSHQLLNSNIETNIVKKDVISSMPISKVSTTFTTSCNDNSSIASSSSNLVHTIPIQTDSKASIEKSSQALSQIQRQIKVSPSIIQTVLRKHPTWQQNCFRQGKQSTEVQTSSSSTIERLAPANIIKTTSDSPNKCSNKPNVTETNVSSSMMEQVREFESVLEEVRKTSLMNEMSTSNMLPQINHEIIQIHSPTENVDLLNTDSNQTLFPLNKKSNINSERDRCSFSFLNQTLSNVSDLSNEEKETVTVPSTIISVRSVTPIPPVTSPSTNNVSSVNPVDGSAQCSKQIPNKVKPVIKTPASSPSTSTVKVPVLQKPLPKLQEDEQTTQRIYAILDKYAEQLRNSPELKNKPAPRRRTNPPTNPSLNAKRKKSNHLNLKTCSQQTSCSSSGMEMSPTSDMQAIDSEDSSNAVSHFSQIINSPSRNSDEQTTATVISEAPLIENTLINVNDVIKKINVDAEMKSKVSQSTQIVVSGTSGSFLSIPEGSAGNVRLLVAAGNNQKMYRLHCPVTGPGSVLFHQITTKDSCSNDMKMSSNLLGQNINESTILSALSTDDLQVANPSLGNEILLNTTQNATVFEHKINKPDIILESMEKAQVLENNEKLPFPVMKKNQASQSTFSVIHTLPCKPKLESTENSELLSETENKILENIPKTYCDNETTISNAKQDVINNSNIDQVVLVQEKCKTSKEESTFIRPESSESTSIPFQAIDFPSFHSHEVEVNNKDTTSTKNCQTNITNTNEKQIENTNYNQISVGCKSDNTVPKDLNKMIKREDKTTTKQDDTSSKDTSNILDISSSKKEEQKENKPNMVLSDIAAASAAEIISTVNQTSNTYKQKEELSPKPGKMECESENENENTLSNTVYNMLDNQSTSSMNTKIGALTLRLKNDRSSKNWNNCLSKIIPPGTEKMLEGENLKQLQESFQHTKIKTFKDLKMFVFEQCKKFDNNVETPKEYDLYDDIDGLGVDKPSTNELFPEVAILNDLDKSVSPTLGLLQASTSKSNDTNALQARRKSVLSHTTTSTIISPRMEQTSSISCKKNKTKVSFLKQALYNEMHQDSNDCDTKSFINGTKAILDSMEQIDSCPESPSNTTAADSETCMSEDSTSTISSGTPHYNFRKSKRKNVEEDGFIESQVIKRMYRGRTSEDNDEKSELPKTNNTKPQTTDQKSSMEKKESNNRRISNRLKNHTVKTNQHVSNKSPQMDSPPYKITTTRASLRRVSRKST